MLFWIDRTFFKKKAKILGKSEYSCIVPVKKKKIRQQ
ncbi:hypothetical protein PRBEI_2001801900 [Prionailurus iriomotensis]